MMLQGTRRLLLQGGKQHGRAAVRCAHATQPPSTSTSSSQPSPVLDGSPTAAASGAGGSAVLEGGRAPPSCWPAWVTAATRRSPVASSSRSRGVAPAPPLAASSSIRPLAVDSSWASCGREVSDGRAGQVRSVGTRRRQRRRQAQAAAAGTSGGGPASWPDRWHGAPGSHLLLGLGHSGQEGCGVPRHRPSALLQPLLQYRATAIALWTPIVGPMLHGRVCSVCCSHVSPCPLKQHP